MKSWTDHRKDVEIIVKKFKHALQVPSKSPSKLGSTNMVRNIAYFHWDKELGIRGLDQIIEIDPLKQVVFVEPGINMEKLSKQLFKLGWMLPVVPEFKGITVGGAINGAAIESSSHRLGQFNDICLSYEVLLGSGTIIQASPENNADLFYGLSGTYGTLGLILSVEIQIVPLKPWVKLSYFHFNHLKEGFEKIENAIGRSDCLEAIVYHQHHMVVIEGQFCAEKPLAPQLHLNAPWSRWYYQYVKAFGNQESQSCLPLLEYLFRHDRGAFWMGSYAVHWTLLLRYYMENRLGLKNYAQKWFGNLVFEKYFRVKDPGLFFRTMIGPSMGSQNLYKVLHAQSEKWFEERFIVQDYYIPLKNALNFVEYCIDRTQIFPLWICPVKSVRTPQILAPHYKPDKEQMLLDVGVYGMPFKNPAVQELNQILEKRMRELCGRKMLYSYNYDTKELFWKFYPEEAYKILRKKYQAETWPLIEEKIQILCTSLSA